MHHPSRGLIDDQALLSGVISLDYPNQAETIEVSLGHGQDQKVAFLGRSFGEGLLNRLECKIQVLQHGHLECKWMDRKPERLPISEGF